MSADTDLGGAVVVRLDDRRWGMAGHDSDALARHLDELRRLNRRPETINQRRRTVRRLARHVAPTPVLAVSADQIIEWIFAARELSPETIATEITQLRQFYRWSLREGLVAVDPTLNLERPQLPKRLPRPMTEVDLGLAIDQAPDRIRPWLLLGAYAGLRCHEIAQLRADDLWWDTSPPLIMVFDSKGGDSTSVAMCDHLAVALRDCGLPRSGWLFRRRDGKTGPVKPSLVSHLCNRYLASLGVPTRMHSTRHRFGTQTLRASGGNLRVTQEAMRHASVASTQRYTYITPGEVAAAVNRLPVAEGTTA